LMDCIQTRDISTWALWARMSQVVQIGISETMKQQN